MQQISWAKLFVCLKELPNPHRAAPGTCFGSAYGTSPHPPGGSTSSCFSRRPAATPLDTSGDPSQRLAQGSPHVQGSSYPHPLLRYRVVMTHTLGVTPPLSLMPKTIFDLLPALLKLWQAGWSRTLGGKPRESRNCSICNWLQKEQQSNNLYVITQYMLQWIETRFLGSSLHLSAASHPPTCRVYL